MKADQLALVKQLRHALHDCPEVSGREVRTKALLQDFLHCHAPHLTLHECGQGFYAAHRANDAPGIALRADYDALALPGGGAAHLCGHDGHAAALCGVALMLENQRVERNVFLLFQPAEETGAGAEGCLALLAQEQVAEIYGAHNLPGFPLGQVVTREGTFACASRGMTLRFTGKPTHAAYPENGVSPAPAVGQLLCDLPHLAAPEGYQGMTLCTVIGVQMGEKAFGAAAEAAEVWLTLRGEHNADLALLRQRVLSRAEALAQAHCLGFAFEEQDVFPATENHPAQARKVMARCDGALLPQPMRWSEDFGHYLLHCPGAFFGIGAGEGCAPLHTATYEYPDALLARAADAFWQLIAP